MNTDGSYFLLDPLSGLSAGGIGVFFVLIAVYSAGYLRGRSGWLAYYLYLTATLLVSLGAVLSNHLVLLMVFWGVSGLFMYLLIGFPGTERAATAAKKMFIILGATDALMLLGLALIWKVGNTLHMSEMGLALDSPEAVWAYLLLAAGALAKAGAMPFHTWVPDTAEHAPVPVTAYLPASLDKLLGIYLLVRLNTDCFVLPAWTHTLLLTVGSITIVGAVLMALVQHDLKRLLGFHAVSQVGYMVVGIGTGNPIGIAGGLFHMLNHTLYKSALFLCAGNVERQAGTTNLDRLGGLARSMPVSFAVFLTASLAIAGIPPLNGFASKWMIYQGIVESGSTGGGWWVLWLLCAAFGSALTLASFMKLLHAVFLGQPADSKAAAASEAAPVMWAPAAILAATCVAFGVLTYALPLRWLIYPAVAEVPAFTGTWQPGLATAFLLLALVAGAFGFWVTLSGKSRTVEPFVGGERLTDHPEMRLSGTDFYDTVERLPGLLGVYRTAGRGHLDAYEVGKRAVFTANGVLSWMHNGALPRYLAWFLVAAALLLYVLWR